MREWRRRELAAETAVLGQEVLGDGSDGPDDNPSIRDDGDQILVAWGTKEFE